MSVKEVVGPGHSIVQILDEPVWAHASGRGWREYIPHLSRAMVAAGCDGIFMEVHDNVAEAKSDRATQYPLEDLPKLLEELIELSALVKKFQ